MKNSNDEENNEKTLRVDPAKDPNNCNGCLKPRAACTCPKSGGGEEEELDEEPQDLDSSTGKKPMSSESQTRAYAESDEKPSKTRKASFGNLPWKSRLTRSPNDGMSDIELLLRRAKSMGLDPQKLLRNEGINIEQKANIEDLQRLAQNGDKIAKELYKVAEDNVKSRSKLASKHLDTVKKPFQTKNTKER